MTKDKIIKDIYNDEISLGDLFNAIWKGKYLIISSIALLSVISIFYSINLPNIYKSEAILNPSVQKNNIQQSFGNYSSLASLAGINLSPGNNLSKTSEAIAKLQSFVFFEKEILPYIFLPDLMALDYWNSTNNVMVYDNQIYNIKSNKWVRDFSYPFSQIPSAQESYSEFKKIIKLSEDSETGFITLSIKHQSPIVAKEWLNIIINNLNNLYRIKEKAEAKDSLAYLSQKIALTNYTEIRQVLSQLIQAETQKLTLIEANKDYIFKFIEPPIVMETHSEPNRSLICIIGAFIGAILGIVVVLYQYFYKQRAIK